MEKKVKISVDCEELDIAIKKMKQLAELSKEVQQVVESLSIADDCAAQTGNVQKTLEKQMELLSKHFEQTTSSEITPLERICHLSEELRKTATTLFLATNYHSY